MIIFFSMNISFKSVSETNRKNHVLDQEPNSVTTHLFKLAAYEVKILCIPESLIQNLRGASRKRYTGTNI